MFWVPSLGSSPKPLNPRPRFIVSCELQDVELPIPMEVAGLDVVLA